jgi:hypothetical protein
MRDIRIGFFRVHPTILLVLFLISFTTFFLLHIGNNEAEMQIAKLEYKNAVIDQVELLIENPDFENTLTPDDVNELTWDEKEKLRIKYGEESINNLFADVYK